MTETDIAVVGMACRLPGARNLEEFYMTAMDEAIAAVRTEY